MDLLVVVDQDHEPLDGKTDIGEQLGEVSMKQVVPSPVAEVGYENCRISPISQDAAPLPCMRGQPG